MLYPPELQAQETLIFILMDLFLCQSWFHYQQSNRNQGRRPRASCLIELSVIEQKPFALASPHFLRDGKDCPNLRPSLCFYFIDGDLDGTDYPFFF